MCRDSSTVNLCGLGLASVNDMGRGMRRKSRIFARLWGGVPHFGYQDFQSADTYDLICGLCVPPVVADREVGIMPNADNASLKLIETVYRAALDPKGYDAFMGRWDDWMAERMQALDGLRVDDPAMSAPDVAAHFDIALRLLQRFDLEPATPRTRGPQFLTEANGRIVWQNNDAQRRFGKVKSVADLDITPDQSALLDDFLENMAAHRMAQPVVFQMTPPNSNRPLGFRIEKMQESRDNPVALMAALTPVWPAAADKLLAQTHSLSSSECAICALLVDGLSPAAIAEERETSVATVRTQIKRILSKTRQSGQVELVSYLFSLARMAEAIPAEKPAPPTLGHIVERVHDLFIGGRRMIVEEHGPADGKPVLFIHGMLDGTGITSATQGLIEELGIRLICPHRPGFGRSEPVSGFLGDAPAIFAQMVEELLSQWRIDQPALMGHMAGSLYSYAVAGLVPVRGIVNIAGGVPILSPAQFAAMTRRQRLVAYTARFTPTVLPFLINAGIRQIKGGGDEKFLQSLYEHAPVDQAALNDDDTRARILHGYHFTVDQGHMAFATDSYQVVRDWTSLVDAAAPVPVRLVHGCHDPVVSIESVRDFAARHAPNITLTEVPDAGQLVFHQCPELVFSQVHSLFL